MSEFLLQALSIAPARRQADELCQMESPALPGEREGALQISAVLEYLQAHLSEKLTLERVATEFFISKYYLSHCFKEATGFSVCLLYTSDFIGGDSADDKAAPADRHRADAGSGAGRPFLQRDSQAAVSYTHLDVYKRQQYPVSMERS